MTLDKSSPVRLCIRLVPPGLIQNDFEAQISQHAAEWTKRTDYYYVTGSYPDKPYDRPTYSRAYFLMPDAESARILQEQLRGKAFSDGEMSGASVPSVGVSLLEHKECAPLSAALKKNHKKKEKPLEQLEEFQRFLDYLNGKASSYSLIKQKAKKPKKEKVTKEKVTKDKSKKEKEAKDIPTDHTSKIKSDNNKKRSKTTKKGAPKPSKEGAADLIVDPIKASSNKKKKLKKKKDKAQKGVPNSELQTQHEGSSSIAEKNGASDLSASAKKRKVKNPKPKQTNLDKTDGSEATKKPQNKPKEQHQASTKKSETSHS